MRLGRFDQKARNFALLWLVCHVATLGAVGRLQAVAIIADSALC
jgi:hypothetical protein